MRRSLTVALVALACAVAMVTSGAAQDKPLKKVVYAGTTKDVSVGHSALNSLPAALGYWKDEGLDVTVTSVEGSSAGMQQLASNNVNIVSLGPEEIVIGRDKGVAIKGFYVLARQTIFRVIVPADSAVKTMADLRGKTIGVPSLASGSLPFARAMAASVGVDPDKELKFLAVGVGAPGALALQGKQVDALATWDTLQAAMENRGMQFRNVDPPLAGDIIGQTICATDEYVTQNPDVLVGFARGIAKATLFGLTNPEAAVRIHWKMYPQTKPQGGDEAKLLKEAVHVFESRYALLRVDNRDDKRFGVASPAQWEKLRTVLKGQKIVTGAVPASDFYASQLVDRINAFDRAAVIRQAREWKP